ncbi:MAG: DUF2169 domain-containing protein [Desulfobacterales bacterium]|nr:DUF2169 domain-containing protein [Desulfobacterales bacterium]
MWQLENKTPFETGCGFTKDKNGNETWIVIVKATYTINGSSELTISEKQRKVTSEPLYRGEPGESSLIYDTDFVLEKPNTDVVVNGHAYAPNGQKKRNTSVSFKVGGVSKKLKVSGDQTWKSLLLFNLKTPKKRFEKIPITYENAFGGTDFKSRKNKFHKKNPVGSGYAVWSHRLHGQKTPNIASTGNILDKFLGSTSPGGFGPIPCNWPPRNRYGGTYGKKWEKTRKPFLPKNFDTRYHQQATNDQQAKGYLKGGEPVILKNLTPEGILKFVLPKEKISLNTIIDNENIFHDANLYTVILEPDSKEVSLVYHSSLTCQNKEHLLEKTIIKRGKA